MYKLRTKGGKRNPTINWALPDRVFFACGACHILAYAFLKAYPDSEFTPVWICPAKGYTGNHILVVHDQLAFDYLELKTNRNSTARLIVMRRGASGEGAFRARLWF